MNVKQFIRVLVTLTAVLLMASYAVAQGNSGGHGNGGGGGGGGGGSANYSLVRLAYPGATSTQAVQLNDRANVVGTYRDADNVSYGFHYDFASGAYTSLGALVSAQGINQLDNIVGHNPTAGFTGAHPLPHLSYLPPLAGHTHSTAAAINNSKLIVGQSYIPEDNPDTPGFRAIVAWYVDADNNVVGPVELPFLNGDIAGRVSDLTEAIDVDGITFTSVVGTSGNHLSGADVWPQPVSWTVMMAEGTLTVAGPAVFPGSYFLAEAYGVNNLGDAVGMVALQEGSPASPFLRIAGQPLGSLPLLPNTEGAGIATSINDAGEIVGHQTLWFTHRTNETRAVLWTNSTTVVDLNSQVKLGRGEKLETALDINNRTPRGDILAILDPYYSTPCLLIAK